MYVPKAIFVPGPFCNVCRTYVQVNEEVLSIGDGFFAMTWHLGCCPAKPPKIGNQELKKGVAKPVVFTFEQDLIITLVKKQWPALRNGVNVVERARFVDELIRKGDQRSPEEQGLFQVLTDGGFI